MAKNRTSITAEFKAVKEAGWEAVQEAREMWLEIGQETAESQAARKASTHGYALQVGVDKERLGFQSARIAAVTHTSKWGDDPWILRFFEYGTAFIPAMPFMRPAAAKANKAFVAHLGKNLEGKIRRKPFRKVRT